MKKPISILGFIILFSTLSINSHAQNSKITKEISGQILLQQNAWNNGDIEGYMSFYNNSDSLKFVTKNGVTSGFNNVLKKYKESFPDKEKMGILKFGNLSYKIIDKNNVIVIGSWELIFKNDSKGGYFMLLWEKINGKWKIVIDHTS